MCEASSEMASEKIIELFVNNHPGVMVHVASLFARRAFNPEGVLCGPLPGGGRSRMLLLVGAQTRLDQVIRQLEKLRIWHPRSSTWGLSDPRPRVVSGRPNVRIPDVSAVRRTLSVVMP